MAMLLPLHSFHMQHQGSKEHSRSKWIESPWRKPVQFQMRWHGPLSVPEGLLNLMLLKILWKNCLITLCHRNTFHGENQCRCLNCWWCLFEMHWLRFACTRCASSTHFTTWRKKMHYSRAAATQKRSLLPACAFCQGWKMLSHFTIAVGQRQLCSLWRLQALVVCPVRVQPGQVLHLRRGSLLAQDWN